MLHCHVGSRWMVKNLLHIDLSSILASRFEGFTEDGIKWLLKSFIINDAAHIGADDHLEALEWLTTQLGSFR